MLKALARSAFSGVAKECLWSRPKTWFSTVTAVREPGVVGLEAGQNPRETLTNLYKETLEAVKDIPETAAYRQNVEKITNYRMGVVAETDNIESIEATLRVGQVQEIIEQAQDELELIPHMAEWKPWEVDAGKEPAVISVVD